jgi:hypothetical protein
MAAVMPFRAEPVNATSLTTLVDRLIEAKQAEAHATAVRVAAEEAIARLIPPPQEGSQTTQLPDGRKVSLTGKLIYKADLETLMRLAADLPDHLRPLKTATTVDETGLKHLRSHEPEAWAHLAAAVEIKPAKIAIKVTL